MSDLGFEAVIFDLDGVITKTALAHSAAWKKMFDEYLGFREEKYGEPFSEFSHADDYLVYVDGKPRYEGVKSFLLSRSIQIPYGDPNDAPACETICGVGNRKNVVFNEILVSGGVEVFHSTVSLIHELLSNNIRVGVASSSKNCKSVLEAAGLLDLFETRVDGVVSAELKLNGKPEPDIFTTACDNLMVPYDKAVVVEDAVSGVQAGKKGNFGLVIGIAREGNEKALKTNGADIVVKDIEEIGLSGIIQWFKSGLEKDNWSISYFDYDTGKEKTREALLTVGNGYFGTRGAMEESEQNGDNYPASYMAGVYNRLISKVSEKDVENEDFVNVINWLPITFRVDDDEWLDFEKVTITEIERVLHFNNGLLYRKMLITDNKGRVTLIKSVRIASMSDPHMAALEYSIIPQNYDGKITVKSGLYGDHINAGVERYKQLNQKHLVPVDQGGKENSHYTVVKTVQSQIEIAAAEKLIVNVDSRTIKPEYKLLVSQGRSDLMFEQSLGKGKILTITKIVGLFKSPDVFPGNPVRAAQEAIAPFNSFNDVLVPSEKKWNEIWSRIDISLEGDRLAQKLLRLHLFHLMVTTSPNNAAIDFGIPARGLHGEAYRGHIFWDELFILPFYDIHFKDAAKSVLMYRYNRLDAARRYAREYGYNGAMYPWQSGSDGREETQIIHLNPVSNKWDPDHSSLQRHVSLAIAFNIWQYYWITDDITFIETNGAEMFFEICRFWASKCKIDNNTGKYSIDKVMGPDEFHEKYKDAKEGGLKDNTYTNLMVAWCMKKAFQLLEIMNPESRKIVKEKIGISEHELEAWKHIAANLNIVISSDGILAQYDGYFDLKELDWDLYKKKYGNISRMDRIFKAEGKSPDDYKVAKQADTLMAFYNLGKQEVDDLIQSLGYKMPADYFGKNLDYYFARTSHGSTLSRVVHASLSNISGGRELSWKLFSEALSSDFQDIQGGTTAEGIHSGVMAGTIWLALTSYAGLDLTQERVRCSPNLPDHWRKISFNITFKGVDYHCEVSKMRVKIEVSSTQK